MKKIMFVLMALFVMVLASQGMSSGGYIGPYWFDCDDVSHWSEFDYADADAVCSPAPAPEGDLIGSGPIFREVGETVAVGIQPYYPSNDPVSVEMQSRPSGGSWSAFYDEDVMTTSGPGGMAPFVASLVSFDDPGTYEVRVRVTPRGLATSTSLTLFVTVTESSSSNHPPVLNPISTPRTVTEGSTLTFDVSGYDPDGDRVRFSISPAIGSISPTYYQATPGDATYTWTPGYADAGTYTVTFEIEDDGSPVLSDTQPVTVTVYDLNRCPTVSTVPDQHVEADERVELNLASYVSDLDGDSLRFTSSDLPSGATLNADTGMFRWTPDSGDSGMHTIDVYVEDLDASDDTCNVRLRFTVDVDYTPDTTPSVTLRATPTSGPEGTIVHFTCTATGGEGTLSYHLDFGDGSAIDGSSADHEYFLADTYHAVCEVTDSDGDVGSDSEDIVISDDAPEVTLSASPTSGDAPLDVDFSCRVTGGNAPYTYIFDYGDGSFDTFDSVVDTMRTPRHTYTTAGDWLASCTVVDFDGDPDDASVSIHVGSNSCPVLDHIGDQTVTVGHTLTFTLHADDSDDTPRYFADAPFSTLVDEWTGVFSWTPVAAHVGDHTATFYATDGDCEDLESITITVEPEVPDNTCPVADFEWMPITPDVGQTVNFWSTSSDVDPFDTLTCSWDFNGDGWPDSASCMPSSSFSTPGDHPVRLTVSDGECDRSVTYDVPVTGELNVVEIDCRSPIVESRPGDLRAGYCNVHVQSTSGVDVGGAHVNLYYEDGTFIGSCSTDSWTGSCGVTFPAPSPGTYHTYATAERLGWISDTDHDPMGTFEVRARGAFEIQDLNVYNESTFTDVDYVYFRGEDMYVSFSVVNNVTFEPLDDMIASVYLMSPDTGNEAAFTEFPHAYVPGHYWYHLHIPPNHDFLGDSHVFTFVFNFADGSGESQTREVSILNNPPVIDPAVVGRFDRTWDRTESFSLTPYESDVEDCCDDLRWSISGVDPALFEVTISPADLITITPLGVGSDAVTLVLTDWDGDVDTQAVVLHSGVVPMPQCSDSIDNDGDGETDWPADDGCTDADDNDETDPVSLPECRDGWDNDGDGLTDFPDDPGCVSLDDNDETDPVTLPECSDGIDNDGDHSVDWPDDFGCTGPDDDSEWNRGTTECSDGFDNDGDGLIDQYDPDCESWMDDDESGPVVIPECRDGVDNDGDGEIDWPGDFGCESADDDSEINDGTTECSDGIDNDGDGLVDQDDPDCDSRDDDDESAPACSDGIDNDGDFLVDAADPGCYTSGHYDPDDDSEFDALPECSDYFDNDADGFTDFPADPGCASGTDDDETDVPVTPECRDGIDNDGDLLVDWPADPGCSSPDDVDETDPAHLPQCSDGTDNDLDGLIDWGEDPGCESAGDDDETDPVVPPECSDGVDNDGDGLIDFSGLIIVSETLTATVNEPGSSVIVVGGGLKECSDGVDNDGDGETDYPEDASCSGPNDNTEGAPSQCADGADNDGDGLIDHPADPGCENGSDNSEGAVSGPEYQYYVFTLHVGGRSVSMPVQVLDVDGAAGTVTVRVDGSTYVLHVGDWVSLTSGSTVTRMTVTAVGSSTADVAVVATLSAGGDPGCESPLDDDETDPVGLPQCSDGIDNDGDGFIDFPDDPDCVDESDDWEMHIPECGDGLDNDGDGLVDGDDPGCLDVSGHWDMDDDDETDFAGNQPPVSIIDLSRDHGAPGMWVSFDGDRSYDPDGVIVEHSWSVFAPDGSVLLSALHVPGEPDGGYDMYVIDQGWYEIRLNVVDDEGADDTEIVFVHVSDGIAQCDNGIDDDGDGLVDFPADPECGSLTDDLEGDIVIPVYEPGFRDSDDLLITRLNVDGHDIEAAVVAPGDFARISVGLQNNLDYTLDDIRVDVAIDELALRTTDRIRELDPDESVTSVLTLDIPYDVPPGIYDLRVSVSNDDVRRVKYRTIAVV